MMAPGTSSMLRARRRDVNVKPNRRLDRKSSRGMLYENEELRLRTININAEVERGQNDIKKLRRENEQLRREIWGLREEYDRLEGLLGKAKRHSGHGSQSDDEGEEEDEYDEEEDDDDEADLDNAENQQKASSSKSRRNSIRVLFDGLSVVDEETDEDATCESGGSRSKLDQQFFGKIKLPNGREGVYQSDTPCAWSQQQGIYNYSFTPVDTLPKVNALQENDGYFGTVPAGEVYQTRGGPDLFISGAYPLAPSPATFPAGGNLDQLLRQMNDKESECVPPVQSAEASAQKHDRQNVDALAVQLDEKLEDAVKGMRVANGNCFVCLKNDESAEKILNCGLAVPGERVSLMDATQESVLVSATGVPPEVSDDSLVLSLSQCGSVIGGVQRKFYKGVDTGERLLRLKLQGTSFPRSVVVAGCTVTLQTVTPNEVKANGEGNLKEHNVNESKTCKTLDRFRSEISVRLKPPSGKGNRSLDNIYDFSSFPKQLHNTSLPIITAPVNQETSFRPLLPENHHRFEENGPFQTPLDSTKVFSPLLTRLDPQNAFANLQNQTHIVTDDSADSIDVFQHNPPNFHNNPFLGGFHVPVPVNPFASPQYTPSLDNQRNMFLSQPSGNVRVCSPYPHMNTHLPSTSIPSPHINPQHSPQVAGPAIFTQENTNHLPNLAIPVAVTNPGFFLAAQYLPSEISPQPSNMSVSTPVLNMLPPQINSNPSPTQVITNSQNATKEMNKSHEASEATSEVTKPQSLSVPSSPAVTRRPKPTFLTHQQSRSSGEEGASPSTARRKVSRKVSSNSTGSQQNVDTSVGPTATSSPNTKHKTSVSHSRKISGGASSGAEASGSSHTNVVDVSRSSSSGQDSPTKPDRRRRVSIYFNNKKGSSKRRDSVFVPNGGGGILAHSSSLDTAHRYGSRTDMTTGHSGAGETTTCSERERTNSASSRTSSRKHSECSNRGSLHDTGKVPWCGCWGNGCI